ncbi:uncharacterized protein si:ch211-157b11.14 isoform X1 [Pygocentrus nattereri]|uniref:PGC-1 and ERR-induced regulator in muscle protein 1 n=1 Tax=Pygocentrus nattereri TaxID=42514 RepID=A0A3B4CFH4_PYGNA|nr:uncharacterized protein si:ch211-157b11.14 isoform X1 [Pygocentrus nattereri]
MDDLEHSILIAERDWDSFYEESEECSIQQAQLAGLDDSGLSDTDDEKKYTQEPVLPLLTNPGKNEEHDAVSQTLSTVDDCDKGNPLEDSECLNHKTDVQQTTQISLNDNTATCVCLSSSDRGVNDTGPDDQQNASDAKNIQEHDQSQGTNKSSQVMEEPIPITTSPSTNAANSEGETLTKVMESSATPKKEKERWFVTVNDSPVQQKVHSGTVGQKKRRKKKTSKKSGHRNSAMGGQCPHSNSEKEAEGEKTKKLQKAQNKFKQSLQKCSESLDFNTLNKEDFTNIKQEEFSPVKELGGESFDKTFLLKSNCTSAAQSPFTVDIATETPENNPSASLNTQSSFILTHSSQLQANVLDKFMTQLANDQSTVKGLTNEPENNTDIATQNQLMTNNLSHIHDDPKEDAPPNELYQQQEYSKESNNAEIYSVQETLNISLETAAGPSRPIYALSSFWDEMEKLTINDILHLRVASKSPLSGSVYPEKSDVQLQDRNILDSKHNSLQDSNLVDDTADSDYFTHLDDSKPDRSSCEFSTLSDFDEEFLQIINTSANPSPEPQSVNEQTNSILESNYISELLLEQELPTVNKESDSEDIIVLCPQDGMPLYLYPATEAHGLYLTPKAESNGNPFELEGIRNAPSPVLSVGSTLEDQCLFSFSELFAQDIDEQGLQTRTPDRCSSAVSFYSSKKLSVPETYDDFFSDFVVGNLLFPSVQDQTVTVPIFSSSRSVVRDLVFPEVEELIEMKIEDDNSPVHFMAHFSNQPERSSSPLRSQNFYFFTGQRRHWSSFLSLRKIRFIDKGSTWCQKVSSWIFPKETTKVTSYVSRAQPMPHLFNVGDGAQEPFVVQQDHVQYTASISKRECLHFTIKQSDMCLVCIAFASWILKSYNPQSTDMWKAALLANVSAISAIQYLRKYVKKDATEDNS